MSIKILHIADIHYSRETKDLALASLRVAIDTAKQEKIDLWALAGDLFDHGIQNGKRDGFDELIAVIKDMLDIAPIVAVYGTPSHDVPGCYEVFEDIRANHCFTILQPGRDYYLSSDKGITGNDEEKTFVPCEPWSETDRLLIFGLPEPSKAWLLAGNENLNRDEINEKIKNGLKDILLGYGAIRKNNPSIPCLMLYHGLVNGSIAGNGQALTGDIGISKDDLAMVGADYYALGHIHAAQQVPGLPAYYAGSAFPCNWGEIDQKSLNIVKLFDGEHGFSRPFATPKIIPFPHPPRKKIVTNWADAGEPISESSAYTFEEISGFQIWQEYRATPEEKKQINPDEILSKILSHGALPGSRVTISEIPTETVRAVEIQGVTALREKIKVWGKNSGFDELRVSILDIADQLEAEARQTGLLPQPHAWRLQKVRTRGLKGIRRGMGLDEYEIDFDQYDPGLIALVAENGTGKTTVMLNCHLFPSMLTSEKKLQDYFCLKDSYREVYAIDEASGIEYRGRMLIDGKNPSGKAEYFLEKKNGNSWEPIANGKKQYEEKIVELMGSEEIYIRSAFIPSKPSPSYPDLGFIPQGEKKRIFYELAGIGHYQAYVESAKCEIKEIKQLIEKSLNIINANSGIMERIGFLSGEKDRFSGEIEAERENLKRIENAGVEAKSALERLAVVVKTNSETKAQINILEREKANNTTDLLTWERKLQSIESFRLPEGIKDTADLDDQIRHYSELTQRKTELEQQKLSIDQHNIGQQRIQNEIARMRDEKQFILDQIADFENIIDSAKLFSAPADLEEQIQHHQELVEKKNQLHEEKIRIENHNVGARGLIEKKERLQRGIVEWKKRIDDIDEKLKGDITCPLCGGKFALHKEELEKSRTECENEINDLNYQLETFTAPWEKVNMEIQEYDSGDELRIINELSGIHIESLYELRRNAQEAARNIADAEKKIPDLRQKADDLEYEIDEKDSLLDIKEFQFATELLQVTLALAKIDIRTLEAIKQKLAENSRVKIEAETSIQTITKKIESLKRNISELESKIDSTAEIFHSEAQTKYETERIRYQDVKSIIAALEGKISAITAEIDDKKAKQEEVKKLRIEIAHDEQDLRDWEFVAEACGIDGIPALELDAVAPEISAAANALLDEAYGQRFRVEFRTTRIAGKGSKTKQVEDFQIWIKDSVDGWEQPYETLSGGEETWIKKAISDAFEIIKSRNTGVKMLTVFQDELDGKLDPHNREVFFKLLDRTHNETGRHHTIVVTHSEAIQEMIPQKIEMKKAK